MPKNLHKSLQDYLSKIKKPHPPHIQISSSKKWILSGCKHPKTPSFAVNRHRKAAAAGGDRGSDDDDAAATLSDIDRFLFENFKSLYLDDEENTNNRKKDQEPDRNPGNGGTGGPVLFESPRFINPPPDLCGSNRFFVAAGVSGSLMEEARSSIATTSEETAAGFASCSSASTATTTTTVKNHDSNSSSFLSNDHDDGGEKEIRLPEHCIAVLTQSLSPHEDFRRSMQEVIDARLQQPESRVDWDFMEELLFCFLDMNEKKSYKYILSAFVDLIVVLRQRSSENKAPARPRSVVRSRRKIRGGRRDNV